MTTRYNLLDAVREAIAITGPRRFAARFAGHYLLGNVPDTDASEPDFHTGVLTPSSVDELRSQIAAYEAELTAGATGDPDRLDGGPFLIEIKKHRINAWSDWISVGRASNNDIVLTHSSVSKLHARIHSERSGGGAAASGYLLTDTGSSRGTSLAGRMLKQGAPRPLAPGDRIVFGEVECFFYDGSALHHVLTTSPPAFLTAFP